jgi:hypothetical protein
VKKKKFLLKRDLLCPQASPGNFIVQMAVAGLCPLSSKQHRGSGLSFEELLPGTPLATEQRKPSCAVLVYMLPFWCPMARIMG